MPWWWGYTETVSPSPPRLHRISTHFRTSNRDMLALFAGLLLIICFPEISLTLARLAGLIR